MEVVNLDEGRYEQTKNVPGSSTDSEASGSAVDSDQSSEDLDRICEDGDLKEDLQKTIPECYKSDSNFSSQASSDITNDEEFQATALCQFMDILNDLDEVLDKSLLACLDDGSKTFDSDDEDLICKIKECIGESQELCERSDGPSSIDDNTEVVTCTNATLSAPLSEETAADSLERPLPSLGRSKSFSELSVNNRQSLVTSLERASTANDNLRNSMRRLDPIVLPAITPESCEPLTLPVILFLDHVNMRPTSAPIQLQVTAANLSSDGSSGPLILGRRTLLMNRTLSLPSPGESDVTGDWTGRNTSRSTARSTSASSSSNESLAVAPVNQTTTGTSEERNDETDEPPFGVWPHRMSAMLACLSCTVGIFNISRFAIFSVHFGASFIIQFFILSFLIGIPLFTLYLCLGQVLEAGPLDMWRISPIFQGVGVSMLVTQAVIGTYSIIGLSWIFVYFRDSFITSADKYKWALPHEFNIEDTGVRNATFKIEETLPQYFHGEVLQRSAESAGIYFGTIKFQVAFNLAVVWMIVFVSLSKGLRSYGKAVYMLIFIPICGTLILCTKLLTLIPYDTMTNIFSETQWSEFFINSNSWAAAAQETFLTWGILGACVMQLTSHKESKNRTSKTLQKESGCVVVFTFAMLLLGSFLANTCVQILKNYGYTYIPGSFESIKSSQFLWPSSEPMPGNIASTPVRYTAHYGSLVGVSVLKSGNVARTLSGWQPLQLATQLVPATLAVLPANVLSPVWAVIFYFILIMFGIAQQLAIWHCVITGILAINAQALRVWETSITFFSCVFGLAMGLLLSTDAGIKIVHFLDYVWVGAWWQCAVHVTLLCAVWVVRGRPHSPDAVARAMFARHARRCAAVPRSLLALAWCVLAPALLCVSHTSPHSPDAVARAMFARHARRCAAVPRSLLALAWCVLAPALLCVSHTSPHSPDAVARAMFARHARRCAAVPRSLLALAWCVLAPALLCAICVMDFRTGQQKQLYTWRKPIGYWPVWARQIAVTLQQGALLVVPVVAFTQTWRYMNKGPPDILDRIQNLYRPNLDPSEVTPRAPPAAPVRAPDPPPKYTPPPSYSTATGARLLNTLRRSFRTLRRITTTRSELSRDDISQIPITLSETVEREVESQPPNYNAFTAPSVTVTDETDGPTTSRHSLSLTRDYLRRSFVRKSDSVKSIRSSLRRSFKYNSALTTSHEHLVRDAEPISNTVAMSAMLDSEGTPRARSIASVI